MVQNNIYISPEQETTNQNIDTPNCRGQSNSLVVILFKRTCVIYVYSYIHSRMKMIIIFRTNIHSNSTALYCFMDRTVIIRKFTNWMAI